MKAVCEYRGNVQICFKKKYQLDGGSGSRNTDGLDMRNVMPTE